MNYPSIVSRDEWLVARSELLIKEEEKIFHTYSTFARGNDLLLGIYNYLDLTPCGRQESWEEPPGRSNAPAQGWIRLHDSYDA